MSNELIHESWMTDLATSFGLKTSFDEGLGVHGAYLFHWPDNRPPIQMDLYIADDPQNFRLRLAQKVAICLARRNRNRRKAARRARRAGVRQ